MLSENGTLFGMDVTDCGEPELQENSDALREQAIRWGMCLNTSKLMHMQLGKDQPRFTLTINNEAVPKQIYGRIWMFTVRSPYSNLKQFSGWQSG